MVYLSQNVELARTTFEVTATTANLQAPATVPAGSVAEINFTGPANQGDKTWIEVAPGKPGSYVYPGEKTEGTLGLQVPEALGTYAVIYSSGKTELARSPFDVVDVTASLSAPDSAEGALLFDVSWTGEGNRGDRIDLVPAAGGKAVMWNYPARGPVVQLRAPDEPGQNSDCGILAGGQPGFGGRQRRSHHYLVNRWRGNLRRRCCSGDCCNETEWCKTHRQSR